MFWLVATTSPTTYSMVNALNTVPSSLFSALFFKVIVTVNSAASIAFGLVSGIAYSYVKYREQVAKAKVAPSGP